MSEMALKMKQRKAGIIQSLGQGSYCLHSRYGVRLLQCNRRDRCIVSSDRPPLSCSMRFTVTMMHFWCIVAIPEIVNPFC